MSVGIKTCPSRICYECVQFQVDVRKLSRFCSRSLDNVELVITRCCFAENGNEMLFLCSLNLLSTLPSFVLRKVPDILHWAPHKRFVQF